MNIHKIFLVVSFSLAVGAFAADPPQATIRNKVVQAAVYLPNADNGYYRGSRFDWAGVIPKLEYAGHNYFGVWFQKYDPNLHDAIAGPVDEFRCAEGALGFSEAKPGEFFIKIGVGILRRPDDKPYSFARGYQIVNNGQWITRPGADRVEFQQQVKDVRGYAYVYSKTVKLAKNKPELVLEHTLKNTGQRTIETEVYNHDFYVIDGQPTGPDFAVRFPFEPKASDDLKGAAEIVGKDLVFKRELKSGRDSAASYLTGYGSTAKDNDIRVENKKVGAGVREVGDRPISKLYFWSIRTTLCPEAYTALRIEPGKKVKWKIAYQFYTLPEKTAAASK